jgi:predicted Zn-dependent protease with MMP-like domain/Flp pilus assembly protein TadD
VTDQPGDADPRFDAAATALQAGDPERALALARQGARQARRQGDDLLAADLRWLEGAALLDLGDAPAALAALDEALRLAPDHLDALLERAEALFELCRFDAALASAQAVAEAEPEEPRAQQLLGLLAERRGDAREAARAFARARKLDPEAYPKIPSLSRRDFDAAVEQALEAIPETVRRYLANVPITVEDLPAEHDLLDSDPPLPPTILGLFRGAPYGQKLSSDPWSHLPSSIVLFQRNLERTASSRAELEEEIATTLVHEVGHFLGLDEDELWARGLD